MSPSESPCLNLSVARLVAAEAEHFAIWVLKAPYPGGYLHHDCIWPETLTQTWLAWQEMFSPRSLSFSPNMPAVQLALAPTTLVVSSPLGSTTSYGGRLMQQLGIQLWQWLFEGPIQSSLDHSQGIAIGQNQPLRLRLEIRDPDLITLPWEIMQPQAGKQAVSLSQQLLFSRTTSDIAPLPPLKPEQNLNILLVLGQQNAPTQTSRNGTLKLEQEAVALAKILENSGNVSPNGTATLVPCLVDTLVMPTIAELTSCLESNSYNILFYAGHGVPAPDGGLLFLGPDVTMNGTELAQVLTRTQVTLAVFNACWGAQSARHNDRAIARSSLAEVLLHHGVPAVLAMRDAIADEEAISFIKAFSRALAERMPIDRAVAVARQQLLTLYKFNQPAWTLPVLYLHPEFDGQLLQPLAESITELPESSLTWIGRERAAFLRPLESTTTIWRIRGGLMRVGRRQQENDLVISEKWVSQRHAEIICRGDPLDSVAGPTYFLRDFSRFGTLILGASGWRKVHYQEALLETGIQLKFGSSQGQIWEFIIDP
ncbi:CHAT domain-containing protein [Argonema antarcticum]|uniref:CHAT domain-containing protein n=1 Tax=Argonema antarcticum TaxID=2942763 RepID=UPI002011926D|nr:CHAT domain-containing protein [Argonema antarcticum]MCL1470835.1 CHAT domain-containing protein [Argonema antarcticum A004/B2]